MAAGDGSGGGVGGDGSGGGIERGVGGLPAPATNAGGVALRRDYFSGSAEAKPGRLALKSSKFRVLTATKLDVRGGTELKLCVAVL